MIDLGWLGHISFTWEFFLAVMSIVLIDLVLAGDNAVVIAMAVKSLQPKEAKVGHRARGGRSRPRKGRVHFRCRKLLNIQFIKLIGGAVLIWIGIKLLIEGAEECEEKECKTLWHAVWIIVVADLSMGIDNMLAVGAASHGNFFLLLFGLVLSIPLSFS